VTAAVLQEILGGELLLAEVTYPDGTRQGVHYWNRLEDGAEVDLTREQFTRSEVIGTPTVVPRPDPRQGRLAKQHQLLRKRVFARLKRESPGPTSAAVRA
jgi:hypothetical protein